MRKIAGLTAIFTTLLPIAAQADPLDRGETYTSRQGPPEWIDGVDVSWLLVDYGVFALIIIALGWTLGKRISAFERFESVVRWPFGLLFRLASGMPVILRELVQGVGGLFALAGVVAWVMFCQWLKHIDLGAIAMAGLALEAVILVRLIKQDEKPPLVSHP